MTLNGEGRVGYIVTRQGKPVIAESRLGFLFTDAPQLLRNFVVARQSTRSFDETWEQPWGEYRTIRNHYNELHGQLRRDQGAEAPHDRRVPPVR